MSDIAKRGAAAPRAIEKNGKGTYFYSDGYQ